MKITTSKEQLEFWLKGESHHMGDKSDPRSQCCPDFSCCGGTLAPMEERQRFADGDRSLLGVFLSRMIEKHAQGKMVHIAGRGEA